MSKETRFIGIDLGTTQSSMSWFNPKTGHAEIIRNAEGEDKTPTIVYFGDGETLVGKPAEDLLESESERERILVSVKKQLAKQIRFAVGDRQVNPVDVIAEILRKLKRDAEEGHFHEEVPRAIITHPAVFDDLEKEALEAAAKIAGFAEIALLPEPVAAAIAYGENGLNIGEHVLVYDLGGGTFDLAILSRRKEGTAFQLAAKPRGLRCGGDDFDQALYDHCDTMAQQTLGRHIGTVDQRDLHFLRDCRRRKESLSTRPRSEFSTYLSGGVRFTHAIERQMFESLIRPLVQSTVQLTQSVFKEATEHGMQPTSIVLIGGSSQVPLVQKLLRETLSLEPVKWQGRDVAVALGAAYHGQKLWTNNAAPMKSVPPPAIVVDNFEDVLQDLKIYSAKDLDFTSLESYQWLKKNAHKVNRWQSAADNQVSAGLFLLGVCSEFGVGIAKDERLAEKCFRQAADQGLVVAMRSLGQLLNRDDVPDSDKTQGFKWLHKAAEAGDAPAMMRIAFECASKSLKVPDYSASMKWLSKAADAGSAVAMLYISVYFEEGKGVAVDKASAGTWLRKAAEAGCAHAMWSLGMVHLGSLPNTYGVTQDRSKGWEWLMKSAEAGYSMSASHIALEYKFGSDGIPKDYAAAVSWYLKAAELGSESCFITAGKLYWEGGFGLKEDHVEAVRCFEEAAKGNDLQTVAEAYLKLGKIHYNGADAVPKNVMRAKECFEKAAAAGCETSKNYLQQPDLWLS